MAVLCVAAVCMAAVCMAAVCADVRPEQWHR